MKKIKKAIHKHHHHTHTTKKHASNLVLKYRWILIGTLSFVVLFVGGLFYLHQQTKVLGMSTIAMLDSGGDVGGGGGTAPTSKPSCQRTYCSNYKLCTVSSSCTTTCKYVPGKCGVPETCTKYVTYSGCGQSATIKSLCPQYNSYYSVTARKSIQHGCSNICTGNLVSGKCGILDDGTGSSPDIKLSVDSFTCTIKGRQYVFTVKGSVKPIDTTPASVDIAQSLINNTSISIDIKKEAPSKNFTISNNVISHVTTHAAKSFSKQIYVDKAHIANIAIISASLFIYTGPESQFSDSKYIDLTKCH